MLKKNLDGKSDTSEQYRNKIVSIVNKLDEIQLEKLGAELSKEIDERINEENNEEDTEGI